MYERVNPSHPDKVADRIAGAIVDLAYTKDSFPKIAVEVLIGHGHCFIIAETSVTNTLEEIESIVHRIAGELEVEYVEVPQDIHLADNQKSGVRCGDNGVFKGVPVREEEQELTNFANKIWERYHTDGKYLVDSDILTGWANKVVACQSNAKECDYQDIIDTANSSFYPRPEQTIVNPLGEWTGGSLVDSGATNRKLGSDMGDSVTGGGLHGKDLSKADVSVNIYAWLKSQITGEIIELTCAIGDECIDGVPYSEIVEIARSYIQTIGGFEKFAEWGLIRPSYQHLH